MGLLRKKTERGLNFRNETQTLKDTTGAMKVNPTDIDPNRTGLSKLPVSGSQFSRRHFVIHTAEFGYKSLPKRKMIAKAGNIRNEVASTGSLVSQSSKTRDMAKTKLDRATKIDKVARGY